MSEQTVHLSRIVKRIPPTVHAVQGDTGRNLKMIIDDEILSAGMTANVAYIRPDGTEYDAAATLDVSGGSFTADMTQALTQSGVVRAQLAAYLSGKKVSSFRFFIEVQASESGEVTEEQCSTIQDAEDATARANAAAANADDKAALANSKATLANTKAGEADAAAAAAMHAAEVAMTYSGGYIQLVDQRDEKHYRVGLTVTLDGDPAIILTEVEED